jgi:hypothetical protein
MIETELTLALNTGAFVNNGNTVLLAVPVTPQPAKISDKDKNSRCFTRTPYLRIAASSGT